VKEGKTDCKSRERAENGERGRGKEGGGGGKVTSQELNFHSKEKEEEAVKMMRSPTISLF